MVRHLKIGPLVQKLDKFLLEALKNKTKHGTFFNFFLFKRVISALMPGGRNIYLGTFFV